ncbi:MAG: hypothetical protein K6G27_15640, partial [Lachnospiraceae bacterium]|nr:hypothetical protein [Lachnospiraceae bacterium]
MKGKRRISTLIATFMAVILCLTSAVPVSALETGDEILLISGNDSEAGSLKTDDPESLDTLGSDEGNAPGEEDQKSSATGTETADISMTDDMRDAASDIIMDDTSDNAVNDAEDNTTDNTDEDKKQEAGKADDEDDSDELTDIVRVNPLYEDVVDESDIPLPPEESSVQTQDTYFTYGGTAQAFKSATQAYKSASVDTYNATSPKTYTTIADAAAYLRDCME